MNDEPNLRQFLQEVSSFSADDGASAAASGETSPNLQSIGKVMEIAGSGSQIRLSTAALQALQSNRDAAVAMSGQVGSQVKMIVGTAWLIANVRTLRADEVG